MIDYEDTYAVPDEVLPELPDVRMNDTQRRVVRRILKTALVEVGSGGPTIEKFEVNAIGRHTLSVVVRAIRTDCDRYSPRCVLTEAYGHFFVGQRGAIRLPHGFKPRFATKTKARQYPLIYGWQRGF